MVGKLEPGHLRFGIWEAVLSGTATPPELEVLQDGEALPGLSVAALAGRPGRWLLRLPVPAERLNDGVQTYLIRDTATGAGLGHFSIVAGQPLEADLRAEIDLLRAELDLMKRAFRRHVQGGAGPA